MKGGVEIHGLLYGLVWFKALDALEQTKNELNTRFLSKFRSREKHFEEINEPDQLISQSQFAFQSSNRANRVNLHVHYVKSLNAFSSNVVRISCVTK